MRREDSSVDKRLVRKGGGEQAEHRTWQRRRRHGGTRSKPDGRAKGNCMYQWPKAWTHAVQQHPPPTVVATGPARRQKEVKRHGSTHCRQKPQQKGGRRASGSKRAPGGRVGEQASRGAPRSCAAPRRKRFLRFLPCALQDGERFYCKR